MKVQNKTIIVTGAGSGIGRALTKELLNRQASVVALDISEESLLKLKDEENSDRLVTFKLDISNKAEVEKTLGLILKKVETIDGLVNCAGVIQPFKKIIDLDYKDIERVMNINFYGMVYLTKTALPHLLKRPEAHIANVSSMGGFVPVPGQGAYGASKAAVKLFSEALFAELINTNVGVTTIFPGATETNISVNSGVKAPEVSKAQQSKIPMLSAEEVAEQIADAIESNKVLLCTGKDSKMMNKIYRLNPVYATKLIAKKMKDLL